MIATGRVLWFELEKKFGFVALDSDLGDAFLHVSVLKSAGYVSVPAGTTVRVRIDVSKGKRRVAELLEIDTSTATDGEPDPVKKRPPQISN
jgi:CspA family cold shock protein